MGSRISNSVAVLAKGVSKRVTNNINVVGVRVTDVTVQLAAGI